MTHASDRALPNPFAPFAFAIASSIGLQFVASEGRNDLGSALFFVAAVVACILSMRFSVSTYRKLTNLEHQGGQTLRWVMLVLALAINGLVCFLAVGSSVIVLGILITGRGMVG